MSNEKKRPMRGLGKNRRGRGQIQLIHGAVNQLLSLLGIDNHSSSCSLVLCCTCSGNVPTEFGVSYCVVNKVCLTPKIKDAEKREAISLKKKKIRSKSELHKVRNCLIAGLFTKILP